jgi:hypothetical protein
MRRVVEDQEKRERVLEWIARMMPQFPGSPFLTAWERIVRGVDREARRTIEATQDFFDLPVDDRGQWRQLVQSQPFTTIIPGRTARERRAALSRPS